MEINGVIVIMLSAIVAAAIAYVFLIMKTRAVSAVRVMNLTAASDSIPSEDLKSTTNVTNDAKRTYEVFLSFCGKDTRNGFTDFLYTYLTDASIQTFRDDNELRVGEKIGPELLKAIKESKISIPILSKNYAASKWCLLELAEMVDCHTNGKHVIYPIFFDVNPSDVRNQRGSYELAFREHRKNHDKEIVDRWIVALKKVGELKGLELKNETNGREGELVKMVTRTILLMLKKNYTVLPKNLVGIDKHTDELKARLKVDSGGVRVVGIHGMGGLGKTTIAKTTYNQLCDSFESHCFLDNVSENSKNHDGIRVLQKQLISKILNRRDDDSTSIEDAVHKRKVLLVLDDVDDNDQVNMLMGSHSSYGANSRIIITTRDINVLFAIENVFQIEGLQDNYTSYKPDYMNYEDSLQLFSKFAFMRDSPIKGFERFSEEVVSIAAGLPLVLVVLGSTFFPVKDKSFWEEKLKMLRMIPDKAVRKKLKISFEALEYGEKQIFLDIACFFIEKDRKTSMRAIYMWDDCEYFPRVGIRGLISKSLIKVDNYGKFHMHDQLRDLGRDIVREEGWNDLGKRSRLWRREDALKKLDTSQEAQSVQALFFPHEEHLHGLLLSSSFRGLPNLRFLYMEHQDIDGDFHHLFPHLRWLNWRDAEKFNPINLHLPNLVILDLSNSLHYGEDWQDFLSQLNMGMKLKVLDLSQCSIRALPNLSTYPSLEILNLSACNSLCRLDGMEQLKSLKYLNVMWCGMLETLPNLSNLTNLVRLELGCQKIVEIKGLEKLESLEYLYIHDCNFIERLPDLSNLINLKHLDIYGCHRLIEVAGLNKLNSLEHFKLKHCPRLKGKLDTSNMYNLTELGAVALEATTIMNLNRLQKLEILINEIPIKFQGRDTLQSLKVGGSMRRLQDLSCLRSMKELELRSCNKLITMEVIGELESLEKLDIVCCRSLETIVFSSCLRKLQHFHISECKKLIGIQHLDRMESLQIIDIHGCSSLERLPYFPNFGVLKRVRLMSCDGLQVLCGLAVNRSLEWLDILWCHELREISDLNSFKNLKKLVIVSLPKLSKIYGLEELKSLEYLTCSGCESIEALPTFSKLQKLRILFASWCVKLRDIQGLEQLESLQYLILNGCDGLTDLSYCPNTRVQHRTSREFKIDKYESGRIPFVGMFDPLTFYNKNWSKL